MENLYRHTNTELKDDPKLNFYTTSGVRQGGLESPLLFNLFIDYTLRIFFDKFKNENVKFVKYDHRIIDSALQNKRIRNDYYGTATVKGSGYADDIVNFFETADDLQKALLILNNVFERFGLQINCSKTETKIINFLGQEGTYPQSICSLRGTKINNVKTFKYLGCKIDFNDPGIGPSELNNTGKINSGNSAFQRYKYLLRNHHINLKTRIIFLNSYVQSRMTYGCQC